MRKATVLIATLMALAVSCAYADVIVFDDFEDGTIGEKYPGWEKVLAKYEPPTDTVEAGGANGTAKAYQLIDDSTAGQWFGKYFDPYSGELYLNFYAKNVEATTSLWIAIRQDETYGFYMEFDEAAGTPLNLGSVAGGKVALMPTYEADTWYNVQIKYDTATAKVTAWVNGDVLIEDFTGDALDTANNVSFGTGGGFMGTLWIDEVYVGTTEPSAVAASGKLPTVWSSLKSDI